MTYLFTSEAVSEGHPDKVCDAISDSIVDLYLNYDNKARTAIETLATTNQVIISGETSSTVAVSHEQIENAVRQTIKNIGYDQKGFSWQDINILSYLHKQSEDIALGVDKMGAGDQGIMFGYAKKEKSIETEYMPLAIYLANKILYSLSQSRHQGIVKGILPDAKSQVTVIYDNKGIPVGVSKIVLSTQHEAWLSQSDVREIAKKHILSSLPSGWNIDDSNIFINPTGRFVIGGPDGDTGLTGRKIIVDTYGGYAPHGGGAFSGKDPTKVDRSAAYIARYIAKNIVAAKLAERCEIELAYAIGVANPVSVFVDTFGTGAVEDDKLAKIVLENFDMRPVKIIEQFDLRRPIYKATASYGHFGRMDISLPWEKTDMADKLSAYIK